MSLTISVSEAQKQARSDRSLVQVNIGSTPFLARKVTYKHGMGFDILAQIIPDRESANVKRGKSSQHAGGNAHVA
jgi:hypothetical protein